MLTRGGSIYWGTRIIDEMIGKPALAKTCEAIKGILEEGDEIMVEYAESEALDAGLLAGGQAAEHYEMSRYGTLKTWATQLGMNDASALLDQTLQEEKKTLLANWTLAGIMPTNRILMATELQSAGSASRALLAKWDRLHAVRTGLGAAATLSFQWALA
jgi:hypothetical protein